MNKKPENLKIPAKDGFKLAATRYWPESPNGKVVIINSATGVKRRFYERFARFLTSEGFAVLTFDYRGIGNSRPVTLNKFRAFMHEWGEKDIAGVIDWVVAVYPDAKVFAVGHSVGGQVMGLAPNNCKISAMLLVACQSGYWRLWPWHQRYLMWFFWTIFVPGVTASISFFPAKYFGLGESLPAGVAFEWASWGRNPKYILGKSDLSSRQNFNKFTAPILSISIARDFFAPKLAVDELLRFYSRAKGKRKHVTAKELHLAHLGHFDFFREMARPGLWQECAQWLNTI